MKRIVAFPLTVLLLLSLVACSRPNTGESTPVQEKAENSKHASAPKQSENAQAWTFGADLQGEGGGALYNSEQISFPRAGVNAWQAVSAGGKLVLSGLEGENSCLYRLDVESRRITTIPGAEFVGVTQGLDMRPDGSAAANCTDGDGRPYLLTVSAEGELGRIDLKELEEDFYQDLCAVSGGFLLKGYRNVWALDQDGRPIKMLGEPGQWLHILRSGETAVLASSDESGTRLHLLDENFDTAAEYRLKARYEAFFSGPEGVVFAQSGNTIYRLDYRADRREGLVNAFASGFNPAGFVYVNEDCLFALKRQNAALWSVSDAADLTILRLVTYAENGSDVYQLESIIRDFNDQSPEIKIDLINYADYDAEGQQNGRMRLNADILSGSCPDIYDLSALSSRSYAAKGLLEDLKPWIERDPMLDYGDFLPCVMSVLEQDGKLYDMAPTVFLHLACAGAETVGEAQHVGMEELMTLAKSHSATAIFGQITRSEFFENLLRYSGESFVDSASAQCRFDSEEFVALLELSRGLLPDRAPGEDEIPDFMLEEGYTDTAGRVSVGEQLFYYTQLSNLPLEQYLNCEYLFRGEARFTGFPGSGSSGISLRCPVRLGMSASSANKEAVWAFFSFLLSDEYLGTLAWDDLPDFNCGSEWKLFGIPIRQSMLDRRMDYWQSHCTGWGVTAFYKGEQILLPEAKPDENTLSRVMALLERADCLDDCDAELLNIILDASAAFYAEDKSAKETAGQIQSRASIYLSEQYG